MKCTVVPIKSSKKGFYCITSSIYVYKLHTYKSKTKCAAHDPNKKTSHNFRRIKIFMPSKKCLDQSRRIFGKWDSKSWGVQVAVLWRKHSPVSLWLFLGVNPSTFLLPGFYSGGVAGSIIGQIWSPTTFCGHFIFWRFILQRLSWQQHVDALREPSVTMFGLCSGGYRNLILCWYVYILACLRMLIFQFNELVFTDIFLHM